MILHLKVSYIQHTNLFQRGWTGYDQSETVQSEPVNANITQRGKYKPSEHFDVYFSDETESSEPPYSC